ncbi:DUF3562 domain-containing protein [Cupriavidus sp. CP313]
MLACPIAFPSAHAQSEFSCANFGSLFFAEGSRYAKIYVETLRDFIAEARIQDYVPPFVAKRVKGALRHHANAQKHHARK